MTTITHTKQAVPSGTWNVDPVHSQVGFSIRHLFSNVHGTFGKYDGKVQYDSKNPAASQVQVDIDADHPENWDVRSRAEI